MTRVLPQYAMAPKASFDGTALIEGMLSNFEITQRIEEEMEPLLDDVGATLDFIYPVLAHAHTHTSPSTHAIVHAFNQARDTLVLLGGGGEVCKENGPLAHLLWILVFDDQHNQIELMNLQVIVL